MAGGTLEGAAGCGSHWPRYGTGKSVYEEERVYGYLSGCIIDTGGRGNPMKRIYQVAGFVFLAFSAYLVFQSRQMEYYTDLGPGPGFFPLWLGVLLALLSSIWLVQVSRGPKGTLEEGFIPAWQGALRVLAVLAAMALFGWVVEDLGFQLTMLIFLGFLLMVLGRQKPFVSAAVAIAGSFGVYYLFTHWLDVKLPASSIEFFRNLGM